MTLYAKKALLGFEDIHFDTNGAGATAETPCSDGINTRTVHKLNASHLPLPSALRSQMDDATNIAEALTFLLTAVVVSEATTTQKGIVELATEAEVLTGTSTILAVTPAAMVNRTATENRTGLIQVATEVETLDGTNDAKAVTPLKMKAAIDAIATAEVPDASETVKGKVELATTAEAAAGTDTARAVTPAGLAAFNTALVGKTIAEYGSVSALGAKLAGSSGWTVSKNSTGHYQLNITVSGTYIVVVSAATSAADATIWALHNASTGVFENDTASNINSVSRAAGNYADEQFTFYAIKVS